jgi:acyl-CoA synthetase (AMP-forming)/AMP-acid ligase II
VIEAEKATLRGVTDVRAAGGVALRVLQMAASPAKAGCPFIGGRADDTIIRSGENIAPAEIEEVLVEHDDVRACAVVGAEDPEWGQVIAAVVVPHTGSHPGPSKSGSTYARACAAPVRPTGSVFRADLPTNATGKLSDAIWSPRCVRRHVDRRLLTPLRPSPGCRAQSTCSIVAVRLALTNAVRAPAI